MTNNNSKNLVSRYVLNIPKLIKVYSAKTTVVNAMLLRQVNKYQASVMNKFNKMIMELLLDVRYNT